MLHRLSYNDLTLVYTDSGQIYGSTANHLGMNDKILCNLMS
jgi:hypothetical protein